MPFRRERQLPCISLIYNPVFCNEGVVKDMQGQIDSARPKSPTALFINQVTEIQFGTYSNVI